MLLERALDKDSYVRVEALNALSHMQGDSEEVVEIMMQILTGDGHG